MDRIEKTQQKISDFLGRNIGIAIDYDKITLSYNEYNFLEIYIDSFVLRFNYPKIKFDATMAVVELEDIQIVAGILISLNDATKREKLLRIIKENYIEIFV